jgi:hypothetical protein
MNDLITLPRATVQQALEALEWHYRQGHSNTLGGFRLKIDEKAIRALKAALAQPRQFTFTPKPPSPPPAPGGYDGTEAGLHDFSWRNHG